MPLKNFSLVILLVISISGIKAQSKLQSGFLADEYTEMLKISRYQADTPWVNIKMSHPQNYQMVYRSSIVGLLNRWDLWMSDDQVAVISIRGTVSNQLSWLENFHAAMVPATGEIQLNDTSKVAYQLARDAKASVHAGWLLGMMSLAPDIIHKIDSCYTNGIRSFIIMGHSQGGAIAYLLRSYLHYLQQQGEVPAGIQIKTYCSAAPKPGNLFYAYDYEDITRDGWGFNVVNSADWVPQTPITIQTLSDFSTTNPFRDAKQTIRKQKFPRDVYMMHVYRKLVRPTNKAVRHYQTYLGEKAGKIVADHVEGYQVAQPAGNNHFVRAGATITLYADEAYYRQFPEDSEDIFKHHMMRPYLYLTLKYYNLQE